jgi:putative spermidine/putrescine transport system substrate-binding protein
MIATDVWATIVAYNTDQLPGEPAHHHRRLLRPRGLPGQARHAPRRQGQPRDGADGRRRAARGGLRPARDRGGLDRAFAKLDTIKDQIVWWEAGAQPPQLLADGEVVMTTAYNGRIFNAAVNDGSPFEIIWDGQVYELEGWVIPRGAPNMENALEFVAFRDRHRASSRAAEWISYGPPRARRAIEKTFQAAGEIDMAPHLPTSPENLENALMSSYEFWVDRDSELNERFNAWIAAN